jgi:uncharacterized protein (TIGR00369 family)
MQVSEAEALDWVRETFAELPVAGLLGANPVACDPGRGRLTVEFHTRPEFCNLLGWIQGGMLTAMLDVAMSFAVLSTLERGHVVPSLEIKTSYLAPAKPGTIVGEGALVRRGRTVAFMEGRLFSPDGSLLTTATATGQIRPRPTHSRSP